MPLVPRDALCTSAQLLLGDVWKLLVLAFQKQFSPFMLRYVHVLLKVIYWGFEFSIQEVKYVQ